MCPVRSWGWWGWGLTSCSAVPLGHIAAIVCGQHTAEFARHKLQHLSALSFSIIYRSTAAANSKTKSANVICMHDFQYRAWLIALESFSGAVIHRERSSVRSLRVVQLLSEVDSDTADKKPRQKAVDELAVRSVRA